MSDLSPAPTPHVCDSGNFDRSICPEPCGLMHSFCTVCGKRADPCAHDAAPTPTNEQQDAREAVHLTQREFDDLLDYSASLPTGTTVGKRWKRRNDYHDPSKGWSMGEYVEHPNPDLVGIVWRDIMIDDTPLAAVSAAAPDEREALLGLLRDAEQHIRDAKAGEVYAAEVNQGVLLASEQARRTAWESVERKVRAALAARPAPVVSGEAVRTVEALDALPMRSVVLDPHGMAWQKRRTYDGAPAWFAAGVIDGHRRCAFPARILDRPTVSDAPAAEPECICDGDRQHPIVVKAGCPWHFPAADDEGGQA